MELERTTDYDAVRKILTTRDIYEHMGDDSLPPAEAFSLNVHPDIWYVIVRRGARTIGLFSVLPRCTRCWELHVCMLPDARTHEKWEAARRLPIWLAANTGCKRLVGEVPRTNPPAIYYCTHGIGMKYVGTHPKAFEKYGVLTDLIVLGMPIGR